MFFEQYLNSIPSHPSIKEIPPVYITRANYAKNVLKEKKESSPRTIDLPYLLNDLGVRRSKSPEILASYGASLLNVQLPSTNQLIDDLMNCNISDYATLSDLIVLNTGNYNAVANASINRYNELKENGSYEALVYSAGAIAALFPDKAINLYLRACQSAHSVYAAMALHRAAVTALKRKKDITQSRQLLLRLLEYHTDNMVDELTKMALFNNLYSLLLLLDDSQSNDYTDKEVLIVNAHLLCERLLQTNASLKEKSQAARYRSQIALNYAQIYHGKGEHSKAVALLTKNLSEVEQDAPEYLSEAFASLAYSCYLNQDYHSAIPYASRASAEYYTIGECIGMKTAQEIVISSYEKLGQHNESIACLKDYSAKFPFIYNELR